METKVNENNQLQIVHNDQMQMMPIGDVKNWYSEFVEFSKSILKTDVDFGTIPGTPKPTLYKPGAEKLRFVYGLGIETECIDKTVDFDRPFVDYTYRTTVISKSGQVLAQCEGSCNSMEAKFGYLWKPINELPEGTDISKLPVKTTGRKTSEFDFAITKGETGGQYGKPQAYWDKWKQDISTGVAKKIKRKTKGDREFDAWEIDETVTVYRILNPDAIGMKNTIMKMAQKRAFVGAVLLATGASEFFTQDIEDMDLNGSIYSDVHSTDFTDVEVLTDNKQTAAAPPKQTTPVPPQPTSSNITTPDPKAFVIPGLWYAKLEKCKTKDDVVALYCTNKLTVDAHPELLQLIWGDVMNKCTTKKDVLDIYTANKPVIDSFPLLQTILKDRQKSFSTQQAA